MYAGEDIIFGDKVYKNFNVPSGQYKININIGNEEIFSDIINVREDPIKTN